MANSMQLSLFQEPNIEDITIQWLYEFLKNNLPDMKWQIEESEVVQKLSKKINISIHIGQFYDKSAKYIGINANKKYGDFYGIGIPTTSVEEFKERIFKIVEKFKEYRK